MSDLLGNLQKLVEPYSGFVSKASMNFLPKFSTPSMPLLAIPSISPFGQTSTGTMGNTVLSFAIALTVIFVLLVVIHYGITPVFTFADGDSGSLPAANTTDGQLVWKKGPVAPDISANVVRILPYGFTIQQDIFIQSETLLSNRSRVFLYRSMSPVVPSSTGSQENLIATYPDSNLLMFLSPNTNDLIVEAITQSSTTDTYVEAAPTILNIPIGEVFRLTVVFLPQMMEVYVNGKLNSSKVFQYTPKNTVANFYGPPEAYRQSVRTMNFKYWDRPLSPGEIRKSSPPPPTKELFSPDQMNTGSC